MSTEIIGRLPGALRSSLRVNGSTVRNPQDGYDESFSSELEHRYNGTRSNIFVRVFWGAVNFCRDLFTGALFRSRTPSPNPLCPQNTPGSSGSGTSSLDTSVLSNYISELRARRNHSERVEYLEQTVLPSLNPNLRNALQAFNTSSRLNLRCMGIDPGSSASRRQSGGLVFVHAEPGQAPVRITLRPDEIQNRSQDQLISLLTQKVQTERTRLSTQYSIWSRGHDLDLQRGRTSVMAVAVPGTAVGIETDYSTVLSDVYQSRYGATIRGVCMQNQEQWNSIRGGLPQASGAARTEILSALGSSLDEAIAGGDSDFVLQATWHGEQNGDIRTSDGVLTPEQIAETLLANNRCRNINITIMLESCYSQRQLERILQRIQELRPEGVRNIRIISTAGSYQRSDAAAHPYNSSLISDTMRDCSGTFAYYFSYYYQMNTRGRLADAIRFADLMSRADSIDGQDLQAVEYFTDPSGRLRLEQFSRRVPITEELTNPNPLVTV